MLLKHNKKGFSLVELLVVITIIAILSVTAYVALGGQTLKAKNSRRQQDLGAIQSALEIYYIENNNQYPTILSDLSAKYMPKLAKDPSTDSDYKYKRHTNKKKYQLGATLEDEDLANGVKAYVIGNTDAVTNLIDDGANADGTAGACTVDWDAAGGDQTCIPYSL